MYNTILGGLFLLRYASGRLSYNKLYWPVLIFLFIFSAFRFEVGCDWIGYYYNYVQGESFSLEDALSNREAGWWVLQMVLHRLGLPYPVVNVVTSAIFFAGIHALARRQPDRFGFLILLFPILIVNMPMSGIRQAAAIGFFCFALVAFLDRRPMRFAAWLLLASTVHSSALVLLFLTPLASNMRLSYRILGGILLGLPGLVLLSQTEQARVAISRYIESDIDAMGAAFRVGVISLSGLYFIFFLKKSWARDFPEDSLLAIIISWSMIAAMFLLPLSTVMADRFAYYLIPVQAMIFARIPFLRQKNTMILALMPYLGMFFIFFVWSQSSSLFNLCYTPYQTWIFGFPEGASHVW